MTTTEGRTKVGDLLRAPSGEWRHVIAVWSGRDASIASGYFRGTTIRLCANYGDTSGWEKRQIQRMKKRLNRRVRTIAA